VVDVSYDTKVAYVVHRILCILIFPFRPRRPAAPGDR
jgi:hypothetical protein